MPKTSEEGMNHHSVLSDNIDESTSTIWLEEMHEFILYSQIPASRHEQVLHILAGVTASQPINIAEQCLIYQQLKHPDSAPVKKGPAKQTPQARRFGYSKLLRDATRNSCAWTLRIEETPEPGVKNVISRTVLERPANESDLQRFRKSTGLEWNKFVDQFIVRGSRFVLGNVIIRIFRLYAAPMKSPDEDLVEIETPVPETLTLLDQSGTYMIEASIRADDSTTSATREKAVDELVAFTESLKGAIDFRVPDRLALDTTVKAT